MTLPRPMAAGFTLISDALPPPLLQELCEYFDEMLATLAVTLGGEAIGARPRRFPP